MVVQLRRFSLLKCKLKVHIENTDQKRSRLAYDA